MTLILVMINFICITSRRGAIPTRCHRCHNLFNFVAGGVDEEQRQRLLPSGDTRSLRHFRLNKYLD